MTSLTTHRRSFIKWLAAAPVLATIAGRELSNKLSAAVGKSTANVYERLGVRPFINARGTWTYLSGSLELPEVRTAMEAASQQFVDMFELRAMAAATAACIAGKDQARIWQLPDTTGLKALQRTPEDLWIRLAYALRCGNQDGVERRGKRKALQFAALHADRTIRNEAEPQPG